LLVCVGLTLVGWAALAGFLLKKPGTVPAAGAPEGGEATTISRPI
jgi:hypothetical protein